MKAQICFALSLLIITSGTENVTSIFNNDFYVEPNSYVESTLAPITSTNLPKWYNNSLGERRFQASDRKKQEHYGSNIKVYKNTVLVGTRISSGPPDKIYVNDFTNISEVRDPGWFETDKFIIPSDSPDNNHGIIIAAKEGWIFVGVSQNSENGPNSGAVFIYRRKPLIGRIEFAQKLIGVAPQAFFGCALEVLGEVLLVGAKGAQVWGSVYMFSLVGGRWVLTSTITPQTSTYTALAFGHDISAEDDILAIAAPNDGDSRFSKGSVYIYRIILENGLYKFTFSQLLYPTREKPDQIFGLKILLGLEYALVSSSDPLNGEDQVFIYRKQPDNQNSTDDIYRFESSVSSGTKFDSFGHSMEIYDDKFIAVGAPAYKSYDVNSYGCVHVFGKRSELHSWEIVKVVKGSEQYDSFGGYLAVLNQTLFIAADSASLGTKGAGAVYVEPDLFKNLKFKTVNEETNTSFADFVKGHLAIVLGLVVPSALIVLALVVWNFNEVLSSRGPFSKVLRSDSGGHPSVEISGEGRQSESPRAWRARIFGVKEPISVLAKDEEADSSTFFKNDTYDAVAPSYVSNQRASSGLEKFVQNNIARNFRKSYLSTYFNVKTNAPDDNADHVQLLESDTHIGQSITRKCAEAESVRV